MDHLTSVKMPLTVGDRFLQMFELTFDLSVVSFLFPLQLGGTVYHVGTNQVKYLEIYRLLEEYAINYAIIVPSVLAMLRPYFEDIDLPNLKVVALSGEAVPLKLTEEFQLCCPNASFFNYYGPTECTIFCTTYAIPRTEIKSANGIVSIGKPTLNSVYKLCELPKDGEELNASSELHIGGEQVSIGYVQNEEMNKTLFYKNGETPYYNTGDLVFCDDMGFLYYLGRKDQQVKIQGYRIELMEVEHLCNKALEATSVVVAIKNEKGFDELILFVKETENNSITERLNQYLPKYMVPSRIIHMKDFPMNENGKLDRKSLRNSLLNS
jgi:non-ribosomal peptide synthetase component F